MTLNPITMIQNNYTSDSRTNLVSAEGALAAKTALASGHPLTAAKAGIEGQWGAFKTNMLGHFGQTPDQIHIAGDLTAKHAHTYNPIHLAQNRYLSGARAQYVKASAQQHTAQALSEGHFLDAGKSWMHGKIDSTVVNLDGLIGQVPKCFNKTFVANQVASAA